jgi:predicted regulator of Ras-like GTPase activity (Roadblock/LC7/MglB family)
MPALHRDRHSVEDRVRAELELIRTNVAGVRGSLAATSDGLVVAHDLPDTEPTQVAALAAATLSLASRATLATGCGNFREAVARGSDGYLAVYAAGGSTIVAVVGSSRLNVGMLQYRAREFLDRIAAVSAPTGTGVAATRPPAPTPPADQNDGDKLMPTKLTLSRRRIPPCPPCQSAAHPPPEGRRAPPSS